MAKRKIRTLPRDDDGDIRRRYFGRVVKAVGTGDIESLRRLVGGLHVSDLGAVVEALEPEQRLRLAIYQRDAPILPNDDHPIGR